MPFTVLLLAVLLVWFRTRWCGLRLTTNGMAPTLRQGDRVLAKRSNARPERGDIIVFEVVINGRQGRCISRVIGLPEETIEISDGTVVINGVPFETPYRSDTSSLSMPALVIPFSEYFALADNPGQSRYDSRTLGTIKADRVYGFVNAVIWPVNRMNPL